MRRWMPRRLATDLRRAVCDAACVCVPLLVEVQLDRTSMRSVIPNKINVLSLQKGPDRFETGYGLLSRSCFDPEGV